MFSTARPGKSDENCDAKRQKGSKNVNFVIMNANFIFLIYNHETSRMHPIFFLQLFFLSPLFEGSSCPQSFPTKHRNNRILLKLRFCINPDI